jgi:hypothetical protein
MVVLKVTSQCELSSEGIGASCDWPFAPIHRVYRPWSNVIAVGGYLGFAVVRQEATTTAATSRTQERVSKAKVITRRTNV